MNSDIVLDSSAALQVFLEEPGYVRMLSVLEGLGDGRTLVPAHFPVEVANSLLQNERRGRLPQGWGERVLDGLDRLPLEVDDGPLLPIALLGLARRHQLTAYDAAYLELAIRHDAPLATLDKALARAAREHGVRLILPLGPD